MNSSDLKALISSAIAWRHAIAHCWVELKAGTNLHLCLAAANRDERVFANAQTLDITRKPNRHFAFAGGPHSCIGLNLAKMEGRVAILKFLQRFPSFEIKQRSRSSRVRFRGFTQLSMSIWNFAYNPSILQNHSDLNTCESKASDTERTRRNNREKSCRSGDGVLS